MYRWLLSVLLVGCATASAGIPAPVGPMQGAAPLEWCGARHGVAFQAYENVGLVGRFTMNDQDVPQFSKPFLHVVGEKVYFRGKEYASEEEFLAAFPDPWCELPEAQVKDAGIKTGG